MQKQLMMQNQTEIGMGNSKMDLKFQLEKLESSAVDAPVKGSIVTGFQYFLGPVMTLEYSQTLGNLLLAAASDGVKMWLLEKKIHR